MKKIILSAISLATLFSSCDDDKINKVEEVNLSALSFNKIGGLVISTEEENAEISAFDTTTKKLFTVSPANNEIAVSDLTDPTNPIKGAIISLNGTPNSVDVKNGVLAIALENTNKQANGTIETYNTTSQQLIKSYPAGALPDMVTFSPDGKYIVAANEGEPSKDYSNDPEGSITIIDAKSGETTQIAFTGQSNPGNDFRVFAPNATLAQDVEPEYVAIDENSEFAYIALQENNGLVKVDIANKTIVSMVGLGTKNYQQRGNEIDASDKDGILGNFKSWNVLSYYMPDAIDYFSINGTGYIISANEGDARDYDGYSEETRVKKLKLDPTAYPNAEELQKDENLGRLKTTTANGDTDGDGDFDQIYGYGARSFSIWNTDGALVFDSKNEISTKTLEINKDIFNQEDKRSDDKGAEPESVKTLVIGDKTLAFVGLERTSGIMVYDVSNPQNPTYLTWLYASKDISPEGLIVVDKKDSPTGNYLVIATYEVSSSIAIYEIK